jgi:hypothetical protein
MNMLKSKFEEYDFYQPLLDAQIIVFCPKEYMDVYKEWFNTITAVLVFLKSNPELNDVINAELFKHQKEMIFQIMKMFEEKEKHA